MEGTVGTEKILTIQDCEVSSAALAGNGGAFYVTMKDGGIFEFGGGSTTTTLSSCAASGDAPNGFGGGLYLSSEDDSADLTFTLTFTTLTFGTGENTNSARVGRDMFLSCHNLPLVVDEDSFAFALSITGEEGGGGMMIGGMKGKVVLENVMFRHCVAYKEGNGGGFVIKEDLNEMAGFECSNMTFEECSATNGTPFSLSTEGNQGGPSCTVQGEYGKTMDGFFFHPVLKELSIPKKMNANEESKENEGIEISLTGQYLFPCDVRIEIGKKTEGKEIKWEEHKIDSFVNETFVKATVPSSSVEVDSFHSILFLSFNIIININVFFFNPLSFLAEFSIYSHQIK